MKLGILFSGGKDSTLALHIAAKHETVACLITLASINKESYMFHTPNIDLTKLQAEALEIPLITKTTAGKKEDELKDLEQAIAEAIKEYQIEGVITGAVESVYQSTRIQRVCQHLDLWCFSPLWKRNQKQLLEQIIQQHFNVIISGIFAYPLDESWLGKKIDLVMLKRLVELEKKFGISPSGEGGEIETTVLNAPLFKKKLEVLKYGVETRGNAGVFDITEARLIPK